MKEKQKTTVLPWVLSTLRLNRNGARGGGGRHFFGCAWQLQTADVQMLLNRKILAIYIFIFETHANLYRTSN